MKKKSEEFQKNLEVLKKESDESKKKIKKLTERVELLEKHQLLLYHQVSLYQIKIQGETLEQL